MNPRRVGILIFSEVVTAHLALDLVNDKQDDRSPGRTAAPVRRGAERISGGYPPKHLLAR